MKRKVIDTILAKAGISPFLDSDPRYSEPPTIVLEGGKGSLRPIESDKMPEDVLAAVDLPEDWEQIAACDSSDVSLELLAWCELGRTWERAGFAEDHDFLADVVEGCDFIYVSQDEWDDGLPGRSGIYHMVQTNNAPALKQQIRDRTAKLIREVRAKRQVSRQRSHTAAAFPLGTRFFNVDGVPVYDDGVTRGVFALDGAKPRAFSRDSIVRNGVEIDANAFQALVIAQGDRYSSIASNPSADSPVRRHSPDEVERNRAYNQSLRDQMDTASVSQRIREAAEANLRKAREQS